MKILHRFLHILQKASPELKKRLLIVGSILLLMNAGVWTYALLTAHHSPAFFGLVILAYGLGLRHAVDADHIAAIDNTTRKLMQDGKKPVATGLFFSFGHSTIVILLSILVAFFASYVHANLPALKHTGSLIGTMVSSFFLLLIGIINLIALVDIFKVWKQVSKGKKYNEKALHDHLHVNGFLVKLFKPFLKIVDKSWKMYPLGLLFGLGFDTASEVGLLSISAASGTTDISFWQILLLPLAFTAGMSLIDTLDGILMLGAYGWAYVKPVRKLYYNMNITLISVVIALFIGGVEGLQLISSQLGIDGGLFSLINAISLESMGYIIILAFMTSWAASILLYKLKGYDHLDR